ncbi:hypothetical protein ANN_01159 [Periplaneta americana]|uniref:Uncharacterized protein n=1 Tax=Periplaneta americana TaxID=6978 RepID=A0ABQ8TSU6_PERAM|nr:hypothetical protein ANN_01159 [Periplaneta americana]
MIPGSNTESYPAFDHIGLRGKPRKKPQPEFATAEVRAYISVAGVPEFCPAGVLLHATKSTDMSLSHLSTLKCRRPGPGSNPQSRAQKASAIPTTLPRPT